MEELKIIQGMIYMKGSDTVILYEFAFSLKTVNMPETFRLLHCFFIVYIIFISISITYKKNLRLRQDGCY